MENIKMYIRVGGKPVVAYKENIFFSFHKGAPNLSKLGKIITSKPITGFQWHGIAELPEDIFLKEVFYFFNKKPVGNAQFHKEAIRTLWNQKIFLKTKYPKGTMLWGDTIDKLDPYIIAIPFSDDINYKLCADVINGTESFIGYNPNHWDFRESMMERGKWSKWYETELAYYLLPEYKERKNSIPKEELNSFEEKLLEEFYLFTQSQHSSVGRVPHL